MFWRIAFVLICYYQLVLTTTTTTRIGQIDNALFDPNNSSDRLDTLSGILSLNSCICQCFTYSNCRIANYYGLYQMCSLFSANRWQGNLRLMTTSENATVIVIRDASPNVTTTTYITTSAPRITTSTSCTSSPTYVLSYTTSPTSYQQQIYNYTSAYNGTATLEFGLKAKNPSFTWHLDDVSVIDTSASNAEKLVNSDFENGTLAGWQILCSSQNCGGTGGIVVPTACHTGSFCYEGRCTTDYDFLRQSFAVITGHIYILRFWLYTDGHSAQAAYVNIS